jgi:tRNA(Ile)-lysidine synthase
MPDDDQSPIPAQTAKALFADWRTAPALVLAVSGGPDSIALMWLAARWRRALKNGPALLAVTVDHGLRPESAREANDVKRLAGALGMPHRTLRWTGDKPTTGLPAAARAARYELLTKAARAAGASHILTAHTRDDQAETVLMRMARGSGLSGLAAMTRQSDRDGVMLARPLLDVPKARLVATLQKAGIAFALDPTNSDPDFTRPRWRALAPALAAEGLHARALARLAGRLRRADQALELMADGAEQGLARHGAATIPAAIDAAAFAALAEEVRIRLLLRWIDHIGHEGPAELGKVEALSAAIDRAQRSSDTGIRLRQTLAGAMISVTARHLCIVAAPPRRRLAGKR